MAKEQKAIAKLLDKDGITVDFWRFPIKNVDKIISQVLEMVGKSRLGLSKDDLKNFDTFVIQTTEPNGTVIDTVFECSDVEFLDLVKADYKDYFGYYPSEDKFDSEKWSYILSGHKGYKESKKCVIKSIKEKKTHPLTKDVEKWIVDSFSFMDAVGYDVDFDDEDSDIGEVFGIDIDGLTKEDVEKGKENLIKSVPKAIKSEFPFLTTSVKKDGDYFILYAWLLKDDSYLKDQKASYVNLNENKNFIRKSIKESFEYDGAIPLDDLMNILTDEWQENEVNNFLLGESSHWDDSARDENKYIEISAIIDFTVPWASGFEFSNKRVQKEYDKEIESVEKHYTFEDNDDYNKMTEELNEYQPILFIIAIDLKDKIIYADVDLGNGLGNTEVARERLAENEEDFRKQIQRMIESF